VLYVLFCATYIFDYEIDDILTWMLLCTMLCEGVYAIHWYITISYLDLHVVGIDSIWVYDNW
jgi:hypothetical protein